MINTAPKPLGVVSLLKISSSLRGASYTFITTSSGSIEIFSKDINGVHFATSLSLDKKEIRLLAMYLKVVSKQR